MRGRQRKDVLAVSARPRRRIEVSVLSSAHTTPGRVVCLGEGLVMLRSADGGPVRGATHLSQSVGGAECNVSTGLASMGFATSWVSRLGADAFGGVIRDGLCDRGVELGAVVDDDTRPTGLYVKDRDARGSRMQYYRAGSAASAMDETFIRSCAVRERLGEAAVVHTSGITAGILDPTAGALDALLSLRDEMGFTLSVDLNWRPVLWQGRDIGPLLALLRSADVVFLGQDEAETALGTSRLGELRELLGSRATIVLKADAHEAIANTPDGATIAVPALCVDVVESIGAGDSFAAGYLAGQVAGLPVEQRLRQGHLVAAGTLSVAADHAPPPPTHVRRPLLLATPGDWEATTVDAAGIHSPALPGGSWARSASTSEGAST